MQLMQQPSWVLGQNLSAVNTSLRQKACCGIWRTGEIYQQQSCKTLEACVVSEIGVL